MQQQLKKIGVKLTIKNSPDILDTNMTGFDFQTLIFAWVGGPDPYTGQRDLAVDRDPGAVLEAPGQGRRVRLLGSELHEDQGPAGRRAAQRQPTRKPIRRRGRSVYNQVDQQLATNDVTVIPLFQKPTQLGYRDTINGCVRTTRPRTASPGTSRTGPTAVAAAARGLPRSRRIRSARNFAVIAFVVRRLLTALVVVLARDDRRVRAGVGAR